MYHFLFKILRCCDFEMRKCNLLGKCGSRLCNVISTCMYRFHFTCIYIYNFVFFSCFAAVSNSANTVPVHPTVSQSVRPSVTTFLPCSFQLIATKFAIRSAEFHGTSLADVNSGPRVKDQGHRGQKDDIFWPDFRLRTMNWFGWNLGDTLTLCHARRVYLMK